MLAAAEKKRVGTPLRSVPCKGDKPYHQLEI
jgi:hypothetical protein